MILSDVAIRAAIGRGEILVMPGLSEADIRPVGIRLYLSDCLLVPSESDGAVDLAIPQVAGFVRYRMESEGYVIEGHGFALGSTREKVWADRSLTARLDGRSTLARSGLSVHCGSAVIDNIHDEARAIVLELHNCSGRPLRLRPGLPIAMLTFERLEGRIEQSAAGQYAEQSTVLPPRASV